MLLLTALYVIAGGIRLTGDLRATPLVNATFLATGSVLASFLGTTGAAMLLIRPAPPDQSRAHARHAHGRLLHLPGREHRRPPHPARRSPALPRLPRGRALHLDASASAALALHRGRSAARVLRLGLGRATDGSRPARSFATSRQREPLRIAGTPTSSGSAGVLLAVAFLRAPWRRPLILAARRRSRSGTTPRAVHRANDFTPRPHDRGRRPVLRNLRHHDPRARASATRGGELGVREPWQFFWATGALSSFLDNAPTYLTFLALGQGLRLPEEVVGRAQPRSWPRSASAPCSWGRTPTSATRRTSWSRRSPRRPGVRMPSFLGYMLYSGAILLPVFAAVTWLFFRD